MTDDMLPPVAPPVAPAALAPWNLRSSRARAARRGKRFGHTGYTVCSALAVIAIIGGVALLVTGQHIGLSLIGVGGLLLLPALWWKFYLSKVPPAGTDLDGRLSREVLGRLNPRTAYAPQTLWDTLRSQWQVLFLTNHLLLPADQLGQLLSTDSGALNSALQTATKLTDDAGSPTIEPGHIAAALLLETPAVLELLTRTKLGRDDLLGVLGWLDRALEASNQPRRNFGGIGRDWANGFTPRLNQFGHNVSLSIEARGGAHFGALADSPGVAAMKTAFSQGAGAIALIGPNGIGKTSHVYALAQNILEQATDQRLSHQQIFALDASSIISAATRPGQLEYILNTLLYEARHAGNIVLFLDDAELFLNTAPGSFNAAQILLPVLQNRAVPLILALNPHDYEVLKGSNPSFAGLLTPVVLQEPPEAQVLEVLCDSASGFEFRTHLLVSYEAVKEAYRLSGRYNADMAYPGKAINLLEQAMTHPEHGAVTAASVQAAIEQTTGVKTATASPAEADQLLHLEDEIHQRMINQSRAVQVVASALRRARAGVASPTRPIGSFLFLGPTGVGKTELAKAIAATYFGDESALIRLDMSEYQQESDVARILSSGQGDSSSLIMQVRQRPFSVVLLDEIEKSHPNILNLLLQLLDEGQLTDSSGRTVSFKDTIVIATSNAGADTIRAHIEKGEELESFEQAFTDELISSGQFKPELLNRFDEIVLFRPLKPDELAQVVRLMLGGVNATLAQQNIRVELTDAAVDKIVATGNDPRLGARPMRRALQRAVEDTVANKILAGSARPGDTVTLDAPDLSL